MFKAILLEESDGKVSAKLTDLEESQLPEGDVTVAVEYSTLNYKDGLVLNGLGRLVRTYPHEATRARLEGQQDLDGVLMHFAARNEELMQFASIARGADTRSADAPPQAAGLQALLLGFSAIESEDRALLERGIALCDALYGWCRYVADEGIGSSPPSAFVIGADG